MTIRKILCGMAIAAASAAAPAAIEGNLVILHTNDTHSAIDPDGAGDGGVLQRKAIIDSVRKAEKNVILVDAGDVVQGTLYFKFFKGDVEYPLMNMMGYDIQILGNHEFDNGLQSLADHYRTLNADRLSANYDMAGTPLDGLFKPYVIKEADGHKIGFIGLNIDPSSIIAASNYEGMGFSEPIPVANELASRLKNEMGCDLVVAVTHIGAIKDNDKTIDYELAAASRDIDIIIGGHSHTVIRPDGSTEGCPPLTMNAEGRPVLVVQTGRYGKNLGYINIDLDNPANMDYRLIPVTDRFPASELDEVMTAFIAPYKEKLKAIDEHVIARSDYGMKAHERKGAYVNWAADFAADYGRLKADSLRAAGVDIPELDFAMMNVGGIRHSMPAGDITEGNILATFPFSNHMVLSAVKGADFIEAMRVAAEKGGEAISDELRVITDDEGHLVRVLLNGEEMDPDATYLMSTIDYLAWGNDDFVSLARGEILWRDEPEMSAPMMRYLGEHTRRGVPVDGDPRPRFVREVRLK